MPEHRPDRQPPPVRLEVPAYIHTEMDGRPHAGHVSLSNDHPVITLQLGKIAGRPVAIRVTDLEYLAALVAEATTAQARLASLTLTGAAQ